MTKAAALHRHVAVDIKFLLEKMLQADASDLHIAADAVPKIRVMGRLEDIPQTPKLVASEAKSLIYSILSEEQIKEFETDKELDASLVIEKLSRFRINVLNDRGSVGAVFRAVSFDIPTFDDLGIPHQVRDIVDLPNGLVLLCGPTGSGKSSTLAAFVDKINETQSKHIVTIEDPIEFVYINRNSLIRQREVRKDTESFAAALRRVLRQDPDVILVGEMRDKETISSALMAAETGHLVFSTLHTNDATQTLTRIIDVFPAEEKDQVRTMLSFVLQAVLVQKLVPRLNPKKGRYGGLCLATEIMLPNPAIRANIRENRFEQIANVVATGSALGMQTMNQTLSELCRKGMIYYDQAMMTSNNPLELELMLRASAEKNNKQ